MVEYNLVDFAKGVSDILTGAFTKDAMEVTRKFEVGEYKRRYGVLKEGEDKIRIYGPYITPEPFFIYLLKIYHPREYEVGVSLSVADREKTFEKRVTSDIDPYEITSSMLRFPYDKINRISMKTKEFEVTLDPKGITIKLREKRDLNKIFKGIAGSLFAFMRVSERFRSVEGDLDFVITTIYSDQRRRGSLKCIVKVDGSRYGVKINDFFI